MNHSVKCLVIGVMVFIYWVASLLIMALTDDRKDLAEKTQEEVAESWSKPQNFIGPILCVPVSYADSLSKEPFTCLYILPEKLDVKAEVDNETLHRGIYDASVYTTKLQSQGHFDLSNMKEITTDNRGRRLRHDWTHAQIVTGINDKRGLQEGMKCSIGGLETELNEYFHNYGVKSLSTPLPYYADVAICREVDLSAMMGNKEVTFALETNLKGSSWLAVAPIGRNSEITMSGNCSSPSFEGLTLPTSRTVTDQDFTATWKVNSLNRNDCDQEFYSKHDQVDFETVKSKMLVIGGQYTQTDRVLKYAFFVILLSLIAIFVAELYVGREISLFNYLLIGAALALFYLMLLSLGEVIGFTAAYFVSALLIIGMVTIYLKAIVRQNAVALAVCGFLMVVDLFIYILLSLENWSLLVGTCGLFIILAIAMYFSLHIKQLTSNKVDNKVDNKTNQITQ